MTFTRRDLLRLGGLGVAVGVGGCVYNGPFSYARVDLSVREPFETSAPVAFPVSASVEVQSVETDVAALYGIEVVALDDEETVLASRSLGDLTWRGAPESQRTTEKTEVGFGSTVTSYHAEWEFEPALDVSEVPTVLTVAATGLELGRDDDESDESGIAASLVGRAAASRPPAPLDIWSLRLRRLSSLPATVGPDDYVGKTLRPAESDLDGDPLIPPEPTPTPTARAVTTETAEPAGANETRTARPDETLSGSTAPVDGNRTATAESTDDS